MDTKKDSQDDPCEGVKESLDSLEDSLTTAISEQTNLIKVTSAELLSAIKASQKE